LSLALGIPAVGVGAFDASAHGAQGPVTVVRSARAGQVILQRFVDGVAVSPPEQAAEAPADAVEARVNLIALAEIAARRLASGDDIPRPAPIYMRPPDAALPSEPPPKILDR
ncbi:MAG: tRNA (adenosine(37)-N6)-threonylcarbamoyltransferase complex dimerization subunit type 1 TsaB, partial [Rubricella sp.]